MLKIQENIALAPMTSFRIGGDARFYVEIHSIKDLKDALQFAKEKNINFCILGGGTNVLISDKGFSGIVIKIKMNEISTAGKTLKAEAGVPLIKTVNIAAAMGLSGIESLAGIPGTLGGAIRGNAGAFGSEISEYVKTITVLDCEKKEIISFDKKTSEFGYRKSIFKKNKNLIILSAIFNLKKSKTKDIQQKVKDIIFKRINGVLYGAKSAGSFFMNPIVKDEKLREEFVKDTGTSSKSQILPAGWLVDRAGLRGKKIGGAKISEHHGNYIINSENATAEEIIMLASFVKQQVRDQMGVELQEEVSYIGF